MVAYPGILLSYFYSGLRPLPWRHTAKSPTLNKKDVRSVNALLLAAPANGNRPLLGER
jgi:hypothetical protein